MRFAMPLPWKLNPEMPGPLKKRAQGLRAWLSKPCDDRFNLFNTNLIFMARLELSPSGLSHPLSIRRSSVQIRHALPIFTRNCGREVRHLIVDQVDDGSS